MALRQRVSCIFFVFALLLFVCAAPLQAQVPRPPNFLAEHYDVSATLDAIGQSLSATAKVEFKAAEASSSVRVELHPNLVVKEVKAADGKQLSFERDNQNPLFLTVQLHSPVASGGHVTLTFTYAGILANEENSPIPGLCAANCFRKRRGFCGQRGPRGGNVFGHVWAHTGSDVQGDPASGWNFARLRRPGRLAAQPAHLGPEGQRQDDCAPGGLAVVGSSGPAGNASRRLD